MRSLFRWVLIYCGDCPDCLAELDHRLQCEGCGFDADREPACPDACLLDDGPAHPPVQPLTPPDDPQFEAAWEQMMDELGGES